MPYDRSRIMVTEVPFELVDFEGVFSKSALPAISKDLPFGKSFSACQRTQVFKRGKPAFWHKMWKTHEK